MCALYGGRSDSQINDSFAQPLEKYQCAEISVPGHKNAAILCRADQQNGVWSAREPEFRSDDNIMTGFAEETTGQVVNVLIEQESHEAVPTWISSVWTTSM